ncbi:MAG: magnesium transporter [Hadesarchaea archaeon]|nr:magnesium transporter [Hadesarchaea archaeon]
MINAETKKIVRQALPILFLCVIIEVGAGSVLGGMEDSFKLLPGLIILVPPLLGLRGNISGALASRLSTALHAGILDPRLLWGPKLRTNVLSSFFLTFLVSATAGVLAWIVTLIIGIASVPIYTFIIIAVLAGMFSSLILIGLTIAVAFTSYIKGFDPDNVTGPIMASIGDIFTVIAIYVSVLVVRLIGLIG